MNKLIFKTLIYLGFISILLTFAACSQSCDKEKSAKQRVFFKNLKNNQSVDSDVHIEFGNVGLEVKPAGVDIDDKNSGHYHILIDNPLGRTEKGVVVPFNQKNIHYGQGQTEADLKLPPGKHTLTIQFADGAHRSYGKRLAKTITVNVLPPK